MKSASFQITVNDKVKAYLSLENSIVVLRGIPLDIVGKELASDVDYAAAIKNKLKYFTNIVTKGRRVFTFEEYLYLRELFITQFDEIYIIDNNLYIDLVPINDYYPEEIKAKMLLHFDDSDEIDDDVDISGITPYISIFSGIKEYNGFVIGSYFSDIVSEDIKVKVKPLFDADDATIKMSERATDYVDLIEETDYIDLVKKLYLQPDEIYVKTSNYMGDRFKLESHLRVISKCFGDWTDFYIYKETKNHTSFEHRDEYTQILKKHWKHSTFRPIQVYDIDKLEEGKTVVNTITQEQIISDFVQQVEECGKEDGNNRDIFVTAPTGAGKSAMFQIPAIYLAEKYGLLTIVISPLIGLMQDQVEGLAVRDYSAAKTINSDISPIEKQEIINNVQNGKYDILYISPETLLSRSDVEQLIGDRTIGAIVIDEAHIVTTWGKGFRPDYWYLGDHIRKLRKNQIKKQGHSFLIATFTATAIYHGIEDMYSETVNSLHMLNPITYLGYVKRDDITIRVEKIKKSAGERSEYEPDKFNELEKLIKSSLVMGRKTLIYFPTIKLIDRCMRHMVAKKLSSNIAEYHGNLDKESKQEAYSQFKDGAKSIMFATKAFGMGIDIDNIEIVAHFAPTGNVCDYVQEIGRAARDPKLQGEACYCYDSRDFRHINRLHGLSSVKKYQLIEVIKKIDEIYTNSLKSATGNSLTRKRNALLLDAESFSYIFDSPISDEDQNINKVKTALLMIQKDFESKMSYSPINVRPIPLFAMGYFMIDEETQERMNKAYPDCMSVKDETYNICQVNLEKIWNRKFQEYSFPQFKFMLYSHDPKLNADVLTKLKAVLWVKLDFKDDYDSQFYRIMNALETFVNQAIRKEQYYTVDELADELANKCGFKKYKARSIADVIIAAMCQFGRKFYTGDNKLYVEKPTNSGISKYQFCNPMNAFFKWIRKYYDKILDENDDGTMYVVNDNGNEIRMISTVLGILESFNVLSFEMIGGEKSQLYIYINQIHILKNIVNRPEKYENKLLDNVAIRHLISVKMLTYLYENDFSSEEKWDLIEDYFLGNIPEKVKNDCKAENPKISF